jgi:hypothetical protein
MYADGLPIPNILFQLDVVFGILLFCVVTVVVVVLHSHKIARAHKVMLVQRRRRAMRGWKGSSAAARLGFAWPRSSNGGEGRRTRQRGIARQRLGFLCGHPTHEFPTRGVVVLTVDSHTNTLFVLTSQMIYEK